MRTARVLLIALAALRAAGGARAADEGPRVDVTVDRPRPGAGEVVRVTYTFSGPGALSSVKPPATLPLKNLIQVGGPSTSTQIVFANGDLKRSLAFTFYLRAQSPGAAEVGETVWSSSERTIPAGGVTLDVGPPRTNAGGGALDEEDDAFPAVPGFPRSLAPRMTSPRERREAFVQFVATPEKTTAYVGEDVLVHYELVTQADIEGLEFVEPPKFPGCWAEDLERPEKPTGRRDVYENRAVTRFTLLKKVVAGLAPGTVTIPAARVRLAIRGSADPFGDPFTLFQRQVVERETQPITLKVLPIPGHPAFTGPVGKFELSARLDNSRVAVGEAVTLHVRLSGTGNLRGAPGEPLRPEIPNVRVYPPTTHTESTKGGRPGGTTQWDYVLVPSQGGELTIPAINLPVFEPSAARVVTKSTAPLALHVEGVAQSTAPTPSTVIAGKGGNGAPEGSAPTEDLTASPTPAAPTAGAGSGSKTTSLDIPHGTVTLPIWALAAVPGALLVLGVVVLVVKRTARSHASYRTELKHALRAEVDESKERAAARVERPLRKWLAERHGIPETLTASAVVEALESRNLSGETLRDVEAVLADVEFLKYAPQLGEYSDKLRELRERASRLLPRLR